LPEKTRSETPEESICEKAAGMKGRMMQQSRTEQGLTRGPRVALEVKRVSQNERTAHPEAVDASDEPDE